MFYSSSSTFLSSFVSKTRGFRAIFLNWRSVIAKYKPSQKRSSETKPKGICFSCTTVFLKETAEKREVIDFLSLFKE